MRSPRAFDFQEPFESWLLPRPMPAEGHCDCKSSTGFSSATRQSLSYEKHQNSDLNHIYLRRCTSSLPASAESPGRRGVPSSQEEAHLWLDANMPRIDKLMPSPPHISCSGMLLLSTSTNRSVVTCRKKSTCPRLLQVRHPIDLAPRIDNIVNI